MILRIKRSGYDNNDVIFDGIDFIEYTYKKYPETVTTENTLNYVYEQHAEVIELWLNYFEKESNGRRCVLVLAQPPIYVMNNDGKTIERL